MIKLFCRLVLKIWGFKQAGTYPGYIPKKVYAVYPHTSNWDFLLGIMMKGAIPMEVSYIAKESLFKFPHGWIFRKMGGIPVNRRERTNFVETMVDLYSKYDHLSFAISPEGTRKKVTKFKTGFYYIALKANIPIVFVKFDYANKLYHFSEPFYPNGVYKNDLQFIINYFRGTIGKNNELSCQWEAEDLS